ncbi:MAG: hypothetical protein HY238_27365 [Acidobacteria bacterium]|nr:hypothetical protein [Acidobacteriota bacterium]
MGEKVPQTYAKHVRLDPPFHFFLLPLAAINFLLSLWRLIRQPGGETAWLVVLSFAAVVAVLKIRLYALRVQDRVIRLEERLRLSTLLGEPLRSRIGELTEGQLIGLRFAPDAEAPSLVEKALAGKMSGADIKKAIGGWRPDYFRV